MAGGIQIMVMQSGKTVWLVTVLLLASVVLAVGTASAEEGAYAQGKTYIEFIFDSSQSMEDKVSGDKSKMDVAKEVIKDLISNLEDKPGLEIGLRVYGSKIKGKDLCEDSGLLQPFGPVGEVRSSIIKIVDSLKPLGKTRLGIRWSKRPRISPKGKTAETS